MSKSSRVHPISTWLGKQECVFIHKGESNLLCSVQLFALLIILFKVLVEEIQFWVCIWHCSIFCLYHSENCRRNTTFRIAICFCFSFTGYTFESFQEKWIPVCPRKRERGYELLATGSLCCERYCNCRNILSIYLGFFQTPFFLSQTNHNAIHHNSVNA